MAFEFDPRLEAMDAQRFDLSKRRKSPTLSTNAAISPEYGNTLEEEECLCDSPFLGELGSDHTVSILSPKPPLLKKSSIDSETDGSQTSASATVVSSTVSSSKNEVQSTDIYEKDGYILERNIIRPVSPRLGLLSVFSRPSSPVPDVLSRPTSPLRRIGSLNCLRSNGAFEEDVDFIQQEREREVAGLSTSLEVRVRQERDVAVHERWRDAIQAILYERTPFESRFGHVEAL